MATYRRLPGIDWVWEKEEFLGHGFVFLSFTGFKTRGEKNNEEIRLGLEVQGKLSDSRKKSSSAAATTRSNAKVANIAAV